MDYPVNRGRLGPNGENQWWANNSPDRLSAPLIRNRQGLLVRATWDEARVLFGFFNSEELTEPATHFD